MTCGLGAGPGEASDDERTPSDTEDCNDNLVALPAESLQEDLDLVQEMEMDRQIWSKSFELQAKLIS